MENQGRNRVSCILTGWRKPSEESSSSMPLNLSINTVIMWHILWTLSIITVTFHQKISHKTILLFLGSTVKFFNRPSPLLSRCVLWSRSEFSSAWILPLKLPFVHSFTWATSEEIKCIQTHSKSISTMSCSWIRRKCLMLLSFSFFSPICRLKDFFLLHQQISVIFFVPRNTCLKKTKPIY